MSKVVETRTFRSSRRACVVFATALVPCISLWGCGPGAPDPRGWKSLTTGAVDAAGSGYAPPPEVVRAEVLRDGAVMLTGSGEPGALIRLDAPEGDALSTTVGRDGGWRLRLAPITRPRMFALSAERGARVVHAEGAVILTPAPGPPALMLRSGAGALAIGARREGLLGQNYADQDPTDQALSITAVDYDAGGFAAVSGMARPGATVRLLLDGAPAGLSHADSRGRYAVLAASRRLSLGVHTAQVQAAKVQTAQIQTAQAQSAQAQSAQGEVSRTFELAPTAPLRSPYQAQAVSSGWRVEWTPPGGGVQTTLVLTQILAASDDAARVSTRGRPQRLGLTRVGSR